MQKKNLAQEAATLSCGKLIEIKLGNGTSAVITPLTETEWEDFCHSVVQQEQEKSRARHRIPNHLRKIMHKEICS